MTTIRWLILGLALWSGAEAWAQRAVYRCSVGGQTSLSDRPCDGSGAAALTADSPVRDARSMSASTLPTVSKASSYLEYLSPFCAELNEGLRIGPARGLGPRAQAELRASYQERCSDDDQAARRRLAEELAKKRDARNSELLAEKRERDQIRLTREQCEEMLRIVHSRRKKLESMTAGERADFERFEANRKARCDPA